MLKAGLTRYDRRKVLFLVIPSLYYVLGTAAIIHTYWIACLDYKQQTVITAFGQEFPRAAYQTGNTIVGIGSLLNGMAGCLVMEHQHANGVPLCYYVMLAFVSGVIVSVGFVLYPAWIGASMVCVVLFQCMILFVMHRWRRVEMRENNPGIHTRMLPSVPEEGEGYV